MSRGLERRGDEKRKPISRRRWLRALGVAGAAGLAGCSGGDGGGDNGTGTQSSTSESTNGSAFGTAQGNNSSSQSGDLPEVGGTYSAVVSSPVETLNPLYNSEAGAGTLIEYALDPGYTWRPGSEYFPLAYDMTTDNGGVWVANVREGLQYGGDYGEVTAEDFVYQITQLHQSEWAGTVDAASWPSEVNVEATGDYEFQIELPNPNALYPETFDPYVYPIPMELMQPYVGNQDAQGLQQDTEILELQFTGNLGAYTLDQWNRSSGLSYSRNDDYYLKNAEDVPEVFTQAPYFDSLEVQVVQEEQSRLGALESGETDSAAVPPNRVSRFRNLESTDVYVIPQPYNEVCVYNMRDNGWTTGPGNLFRNKQFRQGLGCAVDKQRLVTGVFRDFADVEYTWQPRWSNWYPQNADVMQFGTGELYGPEATGAGSGRRSPIRTTATTARRCRTPVASRSNSASITALDRTPNGRWPSSSPRSSGGTPVSTSASRPSTAHSSHRTTGNSRSRRTPISTSGRTARTTRVHARSRALTPGT